MKLYFRGVIYSKKLCCSSKLSNMSKNTASNKFRKVNVDDFDPENFKDDTVEGEEQGPNESEVNSFLTQYPFDKKFSCLF